MKRSKIFLGLIAVLVIGVFLLAASLSPGATSAKPKARTVKIGFIFPTTGGNAALYPGALAGLQAGIDKITKDGGWLGGAVPLMS